MSAAPSDAGEGVTRAAKASAPAEEVPAETGAARMPEPAAPEPTPVPTLNIANLLTLSRLVLVPLFVLALFAGDGVDTTWRLIATGLFAIASATDQVDGWVARKYGLITDFGKIADPIADKALIGAALVGLSVLGELPWWVTIVIAVREIGVTLLRFWVIRHGVIPASRGGKAKTMTQILAIVVYLLPLPDGADPVRWALMGLAVLLTVVTGVDYLIRALRLRAAGRRATGS
ncbi:CDP-diacylglycerol--glycerol-3-phosphate 3-phosphatidyltransferase [Amycolatopsis rhabdoformis]|uniref:CDP-diacylglycerol--glycerol-3-phosphate 3-phosphatidyltransferase n=1 Tax=Amycolatopsis rhabdoformis TaxID=1448059 RepID=A0ABZ1IKW5_9PSEU|nr:CDP-diacylglycerol--glycerol-3-phosphate 3-phosphatidyltransferase [Amycolatopsis rhabdoformis]WSE34403.1 CDP-diacylglycerol--glycerol-3-phosphate 3-phosphatidyltransferase [Amycolatopsis rhabdoformis]